MTFKEKLTVLRKNKGLTQDEFAKAVGVSRQAVYKWENGNSYPEAPKLLEIKALFGISLDDLFDDSFEVAVPDKKKKRAAKKEAAEKEAPAKILAAEEEGYEYEEEEERETVIYTAHESEEMKTVVYEESEDDETIESQLPGEKKPGFFERIFGKK